MKKKHYVNHKPGDITTIVLKNGGMVFGFKDLKAKRQMLHLTPEEVHQMGEAMRKCDAEVTDKRRRKAAATFKRRVREIDKSD